MWNLKNKQNKRELTDAEKRLVAATEEGRVKWEKAGRRGDPPCTQ